MSNDALSDLLDELAAPAEAQQADWADVVERCSARPDVRVARRASPYRRARRRRWWVIPSVAVLVLATAGLALAEGFLEWWKLSDPPARAEAVRERLASANAEPAPGTVEPDLSRAGTVARARGAALVAAPTVQGGYCLIAVPARGEPSHTCFVGNVDSDTLMSWASPEGNRGWYLVGRVNDSDASQVALFATVTHPFRATGRARLPGTPLIADVGPGGFFLARVPDDLRQELDLSYGQVSVLDDRGKTISSHCRFLGSPFGLSLRNSGGGIAVLGDPLATTADRAGRSMCPETGSAAGEAARLALFSAARRTRRHAVRGPGSFARLLAMSRIETSTLRGIGTIAVNETTSFKVFVAKSETGESCLVDRSVGVGTTPDGKPLTVTSVACDADIYAGRDVAFNGRGGGDDVYVVGMVTSRVASLQLVSGAHARDVPLTEGRAFATRLPKGSATAHLVALDSSGREVDRIRVR